jgi:hypothetical protein
MLIWHMVLSFMVAIGENFLHTHILTLLYLTVIKLMVAVGWAKPSYPIIS